MRSAAGGGLELGPPAGCAGAGAGAAYAAQNAAAHAARGSDEVEQGEAMSRERTMSPSLQAPALALAAAQALGSKRKVCAPRLSPTGRGAPECS